MERLSGTQERTSRFHELILQATREYEAISGALSRSRSFEPKGHKDFFQGAVADFQVDEGLRNKRADLKTASADVSAKTASANVSAVDDQPQTITLHPVCGDGRHIDSVCGSEARDSLASLGRASDEPHSPVFSQCEGAFPSHSDHYGQRWDVNSDAPEREIRPSTSEPLSRDRGGSSRGMPLDSRTEVETRENSKSQRSSDTAFHFELRSEWLEPPAASGVWGQEINDSMMRMQAFKQMQQKLGDNDEDKGKRKMRSSLVFKSLPPREHGKSRCMVDPSNSYRIYWDIMGLLFIAYDMLAIPMEAFEPEEVWFTIGMDWITLIFWTCDIFMSFCTGYYEEGTLVMCQKLAVRRYLKQWFIIDLIVVVPDWVFITMAGLGTDTDDSSSGLGRVLRSSRAARILRLVRVAKLKRLKAIVFDLVNSEYTFLVLQVLQLLVYILLMNHYTACAWYFVGRTRLKFLSPIHLQLGYTLCTRMGREHNARTSWLEDVGLTPVWGESLAWKYFTSLHWSITQCMSAPMDIFATNLPERVFSICVLFWALVALSSIIASVTASVTAVRTLDSDEMRNFWMLRRYMQQKKISSATTLRVVRYLEHKSELARSRVSASKVVLLDHISEQLQLELTNEMSAPVLQDHPFFKYVMDEIPMIMFRLCSVALKPTPMAFGDIAFQDGDWAANMFFVGAGIFTYQLGGTQELDLHRRMWTSEAVLWTMWQHMGTLVASKPGELMLLQPEPFADIIRMHPRPWFFAKRYAEAFARLINGMRMEALSDLIFSDEFFNDVVKEYASSQLTRATMAAARQRPTQSHNTASFKKSRTTAMGLQRSTTASSSSALR